MSIKKIIRKILKPNSFLNENAPVIEERGPDGQLIRYCPICEKKCDLTAPKCKRGKTLIDND